MRILLAMLSDKLYNSLNILLFFCWTFWRVRGKNGMRP